jgi:hypothetical protein
MKKLNSDGLLSSVKIEGDVINIKVAPPAEVGTFSEEERSKQVCLHFLAVLLISCAHNVLTYYNTLKQSAISVFCSSFSGRLVWL